MKFVSLFLMVFNLSFVFAKDIRKAKPYYIGIGSGVFPFGGKVNVSRSFGSSDIGLNYHYFNEEYIKYINMNIPVSSEFLLGDFYIKGIGTKFWEMFKKLDSIQDFSTDKISPPDELFYVNSMHSVYLNSKYFLNDSLFLDIGIGYRFLNVDFVRFVKNSSITKNITMHDVILLFDLGNSWTHKSGISLNVNWFGIHLQTNGLGFSLNEFKANNIDENDALKDESDYYKTNVTSDTLEQTVLNHIRSKTMLKYISAGFRFLNIEFGYRF